jgi:hypothetical protein
MFPVVEGSAMTAQEVARQFFEACEAGKGWAASQAYCKPNASFSAQAEPSNVIAYATFVATHTCPGGPPPTGKSTRSDYVYCMSFAATRSAA